MANILEIQMRRDCRHADVAPEWRVVEAKARIERSVTNMTRQGKNPWVAQKMGFFDGQGVVEVKSLTVFEVFESFERRRRLATNRETRDHDERATRNGTTVDMELK